MLEVEARAPLRGLDAVMATDLLGQVLCYVGTRSAGENCYDFANLRMIQYWMVGKGVIRANSHIRAYSDHVSDAPMLDFADEAYAANPHPPLAKLARERGWQQFHWA